MAENYENIAQDELSKLEQYKLIYTATHPFPEEDKPLFWKELGLEAGALIASALGSIALSAIRTSTIFMLTEALLIATFDRENLIPQSITSGFPLASMIVSLVAFEGYLSAHGFMQGKASQKLKVSPVAMWLCFGVTIMAGLSASFGLLGISTENMSFQVISWVLAVLTAIGGPVVAYYGSLNLGVILNQWNKLKYKVREDFEKSVDLWNSSFLSSFSGKRSQRLFATNDERTKSDERSFVGTSNDIQDNERKDQIIEILKNTTNGTVLGTSEISKILASQINRNPENISGYETYKGYVHKIRKEWMQENGYDIN